MQHNVAPARQPSAGRPQRAERDGFVIAAGVRVGHARGLVVGTDQTGHVAFSIHVRLPQQPQRGGEVGSMGPLGLRQRPVKQASTDMFDFCVG